MNKIVSLNKNPAGIIYRRGFYFIETTKQVTLLLCYRLRCDGDGTVSLTAVAICSIAVVALFACI